MTSLTRAQLQPLLGMFALLAVGTLMATPALAEPEGRAVAACRAEMLNHFPQGSVRSFRVADIKGNSRATRIAFFVTADRRYRFECAAKADGQIETATFNPPRRENQLASGE